MNSFPPNTPEEIVNLAERCITHVKHRLGFELDCTPDTLSALDHFVEMVAIEEYRGETPPPGDATRAQLVHLLGPTVGAYFGVTLAAEFGAHWRYVSKEVEKWRLDFDHFFLRINPVGVAANAISKQHVDAFEGTLATTPELTPHLQERLSAAPPIPEDEFFSFCTCYETIQIAKEYLQERAQKDKPEDCSEASYDAVFGVS